MLFFYFRGVAVWDNYWRGYYALEKRGKVIAKPSREAESIFENNIFLHSMLFLYILHFTIIQGVPK